MQVKFGIIGHGIGIKAKRFFVEEHQANAGASKQFVLQNQGREVLGRALLVFHASRLHIHQPNSEIVVDFATQPCPKLNRHTQPNAAREKRTNIFKTKIVEQV